MKLIFLLLIYLLEDRGPWRNQISIFHVILIACLTQCRQASLPPRLPSRTLDGVTQKVSGCNPELREHPKGFLDT